MTVSIWYASCSSPKSFQDEDSVLSAPGGLCLRSIRLQVPPRALLTGYGKVSDNGS
jgi:hypothetical protein